MHDELNETTCKLNGTIIDSKYEYEVEIIFVIQEKGDFLQKK